MQYQKNRVFYNLFVRKLEGKHEGCSLRRNYVKRISGKLSGECSKQNYEMMCYGLVWHKNTKGGLC